MSGKHGKEHKDMSSKSKLVKKAKSFKDDLKDKIINIQTKKNPGSPPQAVVYPAKIKKGGKRIARAGSFNEGTTTDKLWKQTNAEKLQEEHLKVERSLKFIQYAINKGILQMLSGSITALMEAVMDVSALLGNYFLNQESSLLLSSHNKVYQCLTDAIRWADGFILNKDKQLNKDNANEVIQNLNDAIRELVSLSLDKLQNKSYGTLKKTPSIRSTSSNGQDSPHRSSLPDIPLTPREKEILRQTHYYEENAPVSTTSQQTFNGFFGTPDSNRYSLASSSESSEVTGSPPPKPPLPVDRSPLFPHSANDVTDAPPLPTKQRSTANRLSPPRNVAQYHKTSGIDYSPLSMSPASSVSSSITRSRENLLQSHSDDDLLHNQSSDSFFQTTFDSMKNYFEDSFQMTSSPPDELNSLTTQISALTTHVEDMSSAPPLPSKQRDRLLPDYDNFRGVAQMEMTLSSSYEHERVCTEGKKSVSAFSASSITNNRRVDSPEHRALSIETFNSAKTLAATNLDVTIRSSHSASKSMSSTSSLSSLGSSRESSAKMSTASHCVRTKKSSLRSLSNGIGDCKDSRDVADGLSNRSNRRLSTSLSAPPLPLKKKQVEAYMTMVGSYTRPSVLELNRHSLHSVSFYHSQWIEHQKTLFYPRSNTVSLMSGISASSDVFEDNNDNSDVPSLPPKKKNRLGFPKRKSKVQEAILPIEPPSPPGPQATSSDKEEETAPALPDKEDHDSDFGDVNTLDDIDVFDQLIRKKPDDSGHDIRGGNVDALIVHATTTAGKKDFMFQEAFLTTYRTFILPVELIQKLQYRFCKFSSKNDTSLKRLSRNAFSLLIRVLDEIYGSEINETMLKTTMNLTYKLLCSNELQLARILRKKVMEKCESRKQCEVQYVHVTSHHINTKVLYLTDLKSHDVAEQMTLLDAELFAMIEIPEVLLWAKEQSEDQSPHLTTFTEHFNKMSYWCRSLILQQEDAKERERFLMKFIKIMKHLRKINNFNSYLAILSALDSAPIRRLEWQKQNVEALREFCQLIDSSSSFRAYRQALAETDPPCIPYIGLILQDLTFVHIGNQDCLEEGNINFSKRWQQFNILDNIRRFRKCKYQFKKNKKILQLFNNFEDFLPEEALWQISESIKPRGGRKKLNND